MRVLTNELRIKQGRRLGTILFFVSLFVLTMGLLLSNFLTVDPNVLVFVPCLVMPIGLVTTLLSVRLTNEWVRVPRPEEALVEGLAGINRRSVLFNYFPPANHILITPEASTPSPRASRSRAQSGGRAVDRLQAARAVSPVLPIHEAGGHRQAF